MHPIIRLICLLFFDIKSDLQKAGAHLAIGRGALNLTATGRPYSDFVPPTTKDERVLGLSTLSYKKK